MGYVLKPNIYNLVFEDYDGLSVRVTSMPTGQLMDLTLISAGLQERVGQGGGSVTAEDAKGLATMFGALADALVSWTLETCPSGDCPGSDCRDRHVPVPANLAGVRAQPQEFTLMLVGEWMKAAGGVPAPLAGGSTPGATDGQEAEMGIPMEPLTAAGLPS